MAVLRPRIGVASALLVALLLASCTNGAGGGGDVQEDATLRVAMAVGPTTFDPHNVRSPGSDYSFLIPVYDHLIRLNADYSLGPSLAESWEVAEDGMSMEMNLRSDVRFHDGTPFDAEVVRANLDRAKNLEGSTVAGFLDVVDSIDVTDDRTVVIRFNTPSPTFPLTLATNDGLGAMINPNALENPDLDTNPHGSGPYRLVSSGEDRAIYEPVEDYWNDEAGRLARLEIVAIGDNNARINSLRTNEIQATTAVTADFPQYEPLVESGQIVVHTYGAAVFSFALNRDVPEVADPDVRRAISLAIDRRAIIDELLAGQAEPAIQPFAPGMIGHDPALDEEVFDPEEAMRLLEEARATDLTLEVVSAGGTFSESIGQVVQDQLRQVGIEVNLNSVEARQSPATFREGGFAGFPARQTIGVDPSTWVAEHLVNSPAGVPPEVAPVVDDILSLPLDSQERAEAALRLTEYLVANPDSVFIYREPFTVLTQPDVVGADRMGMFLLSGQWDPYYLAVAAT